jgi:hypothetical protein
MSDRHPNVSDVHADRHKCNRRILGPVSASNCPSRHKALSITHAGPSPRRGQSPAKVAQPRHTCYCSAAKGHASFPICPWLESQLLTGKKKTCFWRQDRKTMSGVLWTFVFHERRMSSLAEQLLAFFKDSCSMQLVNMHLNTWREPCRKRVQIIITYIQVSGPSTCSNLNSSLPWSANIFVSLSLQCSLRGSRRGRTWPRGYTPCWQVYTNNTRVMSFIPTKSVACMSTPWLLGNVYTAKSRKGKKRDPDGLKLGLVS